MKPRELGAAVWDAIKNLFADKGLQQSAAVSYYSVLSLAPLLLVLLALVGMIADRETAGAELVHQMRALVGDTGAEIATTVIAQTNEPKKSGLAGIIGLAVLLVGASGVFVQLQEAMNTIWEVQPRPRAGLWGFLRKRLLSFGLLLGIAFLLLVSLVISAALAAFNRYLSGSAGAEVLWRIVEVGVSIALFTVLFAALFKYLPDVIIAWRDVWIGAGVTAVLFALGKVAIGYYLGRGTVGSAYGAAGAVVVLLVWVYYASVILFLGAEFTQVYAERFGSGIEPSPHAVMKRTEEAA